MDGVELFDSKTIFSIAGGLVALSIIMMLLYNYTIIRYLILLSVIVFLVLERNKIKHYLTMLKKEKKK